MPASSKKRQQPSDDDDQYPVEVDNVQQADVDTGSTGSHSLPINKNAPPAPPPPKDFLLGPILFVFMSFVTLVFTAVSIGIPWYRVRQYKSPTYGGNNYEGLFYLFKLTTQVEGQSKVTTHTSDLCSPVRSRVKVMQAFSIISAAMALVMLVLSIVNFVLEKANRGVHVAMLVFAAFTMGALTILVSFNFNVYLWSFGECGVGTSYHSQFYEPYIGFGLTVTAWVLMGVGGLIAANKFYIFLDARAVDRSIHAFTVLALIGMLFSVVACPIPHWFYKHADTRRVTDVLLWREREGNLDWDYLLPHNRTSLFVRDMGCPEMIRYWRAAESFSIISIFFNACAGTTGLLLWKSLMGTRLPSVIFAYVGAITSLVHIALELKIYYGDWCDGMYAYNKQFYVLTAGFGLAAAAFSVMCVTSFFATVAFVLTGKYFPAKRPNKTAKQIVVEEMQ